MRKLTTGEFIERGNEIHNNFYNYSESVFINMNTKLWITCPIHGPFEQKPYKHINSKHGCPECGKIKQSSSNTRYQEDVIRDFRKKHGNKFDYSSFIYKGNRIKIHQLNTKSQLMERKKMNAVKIKAKEIIFICLMR